MSPVRVISAAVSLRASILAQVLDSSEAIIGAPELDSFPATIAVLVLDSCAATTAAPESGSGEAAQV